MVLVSWAPNCPTRIEFGDPSTTDDAPKKKSTRGISYTKAILTLAALLVLTGYHLNHSSVIVGIPPKTSPVVNVAHTEGDGTNTITSKSCEKILNELDDRYNQRRKPRQSKEKGWKGIRLFDLFEPEATCFDEERFGSDSYERFDAFGDGPKFICGVDYLAAKAKAGSVDKPDCLIYSVGSNNDIRFEKAVHTHIKGCEVHTFDPTIEEDAFIGGEYAIFHMWGLGTAGGKKGNPRGGRKDSGTRKSFETVFKDLGHENRIIDVLKVRHLKASPHTTFYF
jgi:Methyltransferase domain